MTSISTISLDALASDPTGASAPETRLDDFQTSDLSMEPDTAARLSEPTGRTGIDLESLLVKRSGRSLVVSLHGALDRQKYALPRFERLKTLLATDADLLLVSDPTLRIDDRLQLAWYTGWPGYDASRRIADMTIRVADQWGIPHDRVMITGSSGGGYAALKIGRLIPKSTIIAYYAQTSIWNYLAAGTSYSAQRGLIRAVYSDDFPVMDDQFLSTQDWTRDRAPLASPRHEFSTRQEQWIYLVQNVDEFHYADHYLPFVKDAVMGGNGDRLVLHEYHGGATHAPPSPQVFKDSLGRALAQDRTGVRAEPDATGANGPYDRPLSLLTELPSASDSDQDSLESDRDAHPGPIEAAPSPPVVGQTDPTPSSDVSALAVRLEEVENELARVKESIKVRGEISDARHVTVGRSSTIDPTVAMHARYTASAITVGDHVLAYRGGEWLGPISIGNRVFINRDSYIRPEVTIEDDVSIGPFVSLISDSHEEGQRVRRTGKPVRLPIAVGQGTWIGAHVTVLGNVKIGRRCIIAAGSVVVHDIPDNCLAGGVPARVIRELPPLADA